MFKKILVAILGVVLALLLYSGIDSLLKKNVTNSDVKTIYITFVDRTQESPLTIIDKAAFATDAEYFIDFFAKEHENFDVVIAESPFGHTVEAINGYVGDMASATGPWILYSSDNNLSCVANGFCLGIDDLPIYDGDHFVFSYTFDGMFE